MDEDTLSPKQAGKDQNSNQDDLQKGQIILYPAAEFQSAEMDQGKNDDDEDCYYFFEMFKVLRLKCGNALNR